MTSHVFIQKIRYSLTSCQLYLLVPLSSFLAHLLALSHISFQRYSEAQPEQAEAKRRSAWTTLIYVKCRYSTSSHKSSRLERGSFPASCGVHFLTFGFCTPHDQHFHFWFRLFAGKIALSSKTTGKCSHLVHFGYCHSVIKYLMHDMMNYLCVFCVPNQSVWLCRVPIQSTVVVVCVVWFVWGGIPTFDVYQCSSRESTFCKR